MNSVGSTSTKLLKNLSMAIKSEITLETIHESKIPKK